MYACIAYGDSLVVIWDSAWEEALEEGAGYWAGVLAAIGLRGGLLALMVAVAVAVCGGGRRRGGLFGRCTWCLGPFGWRVGHFGNGK
jgi:hypothetical protein